MEPQRVRHVNELYQDRDLYISPDTFSPPAERLMHVIRFELTKGCSWARCTYCEGYDGTKHVIKDIDDYKRHVEEVWERIGKRSSLAERLRSIFIGEGNALEVKTEILDEAIQHTTNKFIENTGNHPRRVSLYGRTGDILQQGKKGLEQLCHGKTGWSRFFTGSSQDRLNLIYWGVESGSSKVLDYVKKGCNEDAIIKAAKIVRNVPVETSVMIMPGLGGERFYDEHIRDTARVLGEIRPRFLTFMGVNPAPKSRYSRTMVQEREEGRNRPLTDKELAEQMTEIIARMPAFRTKVGCFNHFVDAVGYNPLNFGAFDISYGSSKDYLVKELKSCVKRIEGYYYFNKPTQWGSITFWSNLQLLSNQYPKDTS